MTVRTAAALPCWHAAWRCRAAACSRRKPPPPTPAHYTLGAAYQLGGVWYYPKDQTEYDATGLAAVTPTMPG